MAAKKKTKTTKPEPQRPVPKTKQEIDAEVTALKKIKSRVRRSSAFGDDHHAAIDAQLDVLEGKLSEDEVYKRFGVEDDDVNEEEGAPQNVMDAALDARRWMDGDYRDYPRLVDGWKELTS